MTPPIRFLATALGSWAFLRGALLVPWHSDAPAQAAAVTPQAAAVTAGDAAMTPEGGTRFFAPAPSGPASPTRLVPGAHAHGTVADAGSNAPPLKPRSSRAKSRGATPAPGIPSLPPAGASVESLSWTLHAASPRVRPAALAKPERTLFAQASLPVRLSRWSASAWLYGRTGDAPALAPGGLLGGSQAGARLGYRLSPALLLLGRVSAPLRSPAGAEAALGVEWQPKRSLPLRVLGERREAVGSKGRSAFALTLHGGVGEVPLPAGFRLDAYAQAGAVGARSQDLFADASVRAAKPVGGGVSVGAGAWGAAQPGASRLDLGPSATLRLPSMRASLSADWRLRVAGDARPGSGPALTLWTDF